MLVAGLAGCATAPPLPLVAAPTLAPRLQGLDGGQDIQGPLNETQLLRLMLLNNPALRASRARHGVVQAQVVNAGIAPNPSISGNVGYLISGMGDATAWSAGFAQSLQGLMSRGARRDEAKATSAGTDATLLWEQWQAIARARKLYIDVVEGDEQLALRQRSATVLAERAQALRDAIARGDVDTGTASPVFVAASDARAAFDDADHAQRAQRAELAAMLGLDSRAALPLAPLPTLPTLDRDRATASIEAMGDHRPDLVALRYGYSAQEARLRGAILSQFPPLALGLDASQDNSRVRNAGPSVSFDLPLFDRGQGRIAVEEATRRQLHDEYTARLDEARGEAQALLDAVLANEQALAGLPTEPSGSLSSVERAFATGDIDAGVYADLTVAELSRASARITRDLYRREQRVAFDTLTGVGLPATLPADFR
jgi:outer membrane protein TolC